MKFHHDAEHGALDVRVLWFRIAFINLGKRSNYGFSVLFCMVPFPRIALPRKEKPRGGLLPNFARWIVFFLIGGLHLSSASEPTPPLSVRDGWQPWDRGRPFTRAFDVPPARNNGEVWSFLPDPSGRLWVGADDLYVFNGLNTEKLGLTFGSHAIRGLAHDAKGALWLGSVDEIGKVEFTAEGRARYHSARSALEAAGIGRVGNIWHAQTTAEGVNFVADQQVIRWDGTEFKSWALPSRAQLSANSDGENLWIFQPNEGLFRMEKNGPVLVHRVTELPSANVHWVLSFTLYPHSPENQTLLLGTESGIYIETNTSWQRLTKLSSYVEGQVPWRVIRLDSETFAIGSFLDGLVIGSIHDELLAKVDRAAGLPHERISGLWYDGVRYLWAGYAGGMIRIEARGAVSVFDHRIGFSESPILKVLEHQKTPVIISPRLVAKLAPGPEGRPAKLERIHPLAPAFSDAVISGGALWVSSYGGLLWRITEPVESFETGSQGLLFNLLEASPEGHPLLYIKDTKVHTLLPSVPLSESSVGGALDLGTYPINLIRDKENDIWASTPTQGILRFRSEPAPLLPPSLKLLGRYTESNGVSLAAGRPLVTRLGNEILTLNENGVFRFDSAAGRFNPASELPQFIVAASTAVDDPNQAFWVVRRTEFDSNADDTSILIRVQADQDSGLISWQAVDSEALTSAGRVTGLSYTSSHGGALWVAGTQALVRISVPQLQSLAAPPPLTISRVSTANREYSTSGSAARPLFEPGTPRISFQFSGGRRVDGGSSWLQTRLLGISDQWSKPQSLPRLDYTGLKPGDYTLEARAMDLSGQVSEPVSFSFRVNAPWFQRWPAQIAYGVVALLLVMLGSRWRMRHLARRNRQLNQIVDERTRELALANVAKNEFFENISHEIRNPLNGISNLVDLLRDVPLPPDARQLAQSLTRSTEHLKKVFSSVLSYTTLEYGHATLAVAPFSLIEILKDTRALFGPEAREKGVVLSLQLPPDFQDGFKGDSEKIRSVLNNYIANSLKYAPHSPIQVSVRVLSSSPHQSDIWIGVRDEGPGLSRIEQEKLFRKFARGSQAIANQVPGTGLGLATCRALAELMDGATGVESSSGRGATFWLRVPLLRSPLQENTEEGNNSTERTALRSPLALIVDDQDYNRTVLTGVARRLGYQAFEASRAEEVWPLVERHRFLVVFLDWELPGLNGGAIAQALRTRANTRDAIVIATTAHATEEIRQLCRNSKMNGFALKPFDTEQIREVIAHAQASVSHNLQPGDPLSSPEANRGLSLRAFEDFSAGDPQRAHQAVTLYLSILDQEIASLAAAVTRGDKESVASIAHRIRSHAGLINAVELNTAARQLYLSTKEQPNVDVSPLLQTLDRAAHELKRDIRGIVEGEDSAKQSSGDM